MLNAPGLSGRATTARQGRRTLVIGCGFIGSHVVRELVATNRQPVVLTRSLPTDEVVAMIGAEDLHIGDAADPRVLETALNGIGRVVFSAGGLLPAASEQAPRRHAELTLGPVRALLDALRTRPGVTLTYLSSGGTVYGEPERLPVGEDQPTRPLAFYGKLHLACEREIARHRRDDGLAARILRCSTVYGEHQRPERGQGAIVTFLRRIERGEPIELYGDGAAIRDYVYAGDVARALTALLDCEDGPAILNLGAGRGTSLNELKRLIESQVGQPARVTSYPQRGFEVRAIVLDTSLLRSLIDFDPMPLEEGIARTHAWLTASVPRAA